MKSKPEIINFISIGVIVFLILGLCAFIISLTRASKKSLSTTEDNLNEIRELTLDNKSKIDSLISNFPTTIQSSDGLIDDDDGLIRNHKDDVHPEKIPREIIFNGCVISNTGSRRVDQFNTNLHVTFGDYTGLYKCINAVDGNNNLLPKQHYYYVPNCPNQKDFIEIELTKEIGAPDSITLKDGCILEKDME